MFWKSKLINRLLLATFICSQFFHAQSSDALGNSGRCTGDWSEYIDLVAGWKTLYANMEQHEFLFIGPDDEIYNCLNEEFSEEYIASVKQIAIKTGLFGLRYLGATDRESCGLTQVTLDPPAFTLVRLAYDIEILIDKICREQLIKVRSLTFN